MIPNDNDDIVFQTEEDINLNTKTAFHTACCYIPDEEIWESSGIQDIRRKYDSGFKRWPPHINFLFPFIPERFFNQGKEKLEKALEDIPPFECTFSNMNYFTSGNKCVLWLESDLEGKEKLKELHKVIENVFPYCDHKSKLSEEGFIPHMTVGYFSKFEVEKRKKQFEENWKDLKVVVRDVCMIFRNSKDTPFSIIYRIPLKGIIKK